MQVLTRLRANLFDKEGAVPAFLPVLPYLPVSTDGSDYDNRDSKRQGRGPLYQSDYGGSNDLEAGDAFGSYGNLQVLVCYHEIPRRLNLDES